MILIFEILLALNFNFFLDFLLGLHFIYAFKLETLFFALIFSFKKSNKYFLIVLDLLSFSLALCFIYKAFVFVYYKIFAFCI